MSVSKLWTNWAVELDTIAEGVTPVFLDGIQSLELKSALQTKLEGGDGSVYNSFGSLVSGGPTARFSTSDLKGLLDKVGVTGKLIDSQAGNEGVRLFFQRMAAGGTRDAAATASHFMTTIANGLMVLRSLELSHQGPAVAACELFAIQSGSTAPLAFSEAAALPSGVNPGSEVQWTLGKVMLNATQVDGLESVSIDFGLEVITEAKDSDVYPSFVSIRRIQPTITLRGVHPDVTATLTEDGLGYSASQVVLYARKRADGGNFTADATAEHVKITLGKCRVEWESISGDPKEIALKITPYDTVGGVAPLAINTASAIT